MKPKIKEILSDAFAVICILVGFSIHSWPSLCFLLGGSICGSFALFFTLSNHRVHGVTDSQARNWALMMLAVSLIGAILFWRECKQTPNPAESKPVESVSRICAKAGIFAFQAICVCISAGFGQIHFMSDKQLALDSIERLPADASLDAIAERVEFLAALRKGLDQIERGETVPHEEVKRQLATWLSK